MATEDASAAPAAGKSKKTILLVLIIVAGVALGGGGGMFLAGPLLAGGAPAKHATAGDDAGHEEEGAEDEEAAHDEEAADEEEGEEGEKKKPKAPAVVHVVDNLVLNPANTGGSRFLLLSVGLAVKDEAAAQPLKDRDPELRDVIIRYFGARSIEELTDVSMRDTLKVQLRAAVLERFGKKAVQDVFFPQFVIQ